MLRLSAELALLTISRRPTPTLIGSLNVSTRLAATATALTLSPGDELLSVGGIVSLDTACTTRLKLALAVKP